MSCIKIEQAAVIVYLDWSVQMLGGSSEATESRSVSSFAYRMAGLHGVKHCVLMRLFLVMCLVSSHI